MLEVEIKDIDKKYEGYRLKDKYREKNLLSSIQENGIQEPLLCVEGIDSKCILLDGYKRLRCAVKLRIFLAPVLIAGRNEAESILHLIRLSNEKTLNIVEQAVFVNELKKAFGLSVTEIAKRLERSKAWVSVRIGILDEMSVYVREEVFAGRFPLRAYMYTLRPFTRVNKISISQLDRFVKSVSGKGLSIRNIEKLAYAYFRGGDKIKNQIESGKLQWPLKQMKHHSGFIYSESPELSQAESILIRDLELFGKYMTRITFGLAGISKGTEAFHRTLKLLLEGILNSLDTFKKEVKTCYDRREYT